MPFNTESKSYCSVVLCLIGIYLLSIIVLAWFSGDWHWEDLGTVPYSHRIQDQKHKHLGLCSYLQNREVILLAKAFEIHFHTTYKERRNMYTGFTVNLLMGTGN